MERPYNSCSSWWPNPLRTQYSAIEELNKAEIIYVALNSENNCCEIVVHQKVGSTLAIRDL